MFEVKNQRLYYNASSPSIGNQNHTDILQMLQKNRQICQKCSNKIVYKCMQSECNEADLICPKCDVLDYKGEHFNHTFTFILPLLKDPRKVNFKEIRQRGNQYLKNLKNIQIYLNKCLSDVETQIKEKEKKLEQFQKLINSCGFSQFEKKMRKMKEIKSLNELMQGVSFPSIEKYEKILTQLVQPSFPLFELENKDFSQNSQFKVVSECLTTISRMNAQVHECGLFIPYLKLNFNQVDANNFLDCVKIKNIYTDNLEYSSVHINIDKISTVKEAACRLSEFQKCRKLSVEGSANKFENSTYDFKFVKGLVSCSKLSNLSIKGGHQFISFILQCIRMNKFIERVEISTKFLIQDDLLTYLSGARSLCFNYERLQSRDNQMNQIASFLWNSNLKGIEFKLKNSQQKPIDGAALESFLKYLQGAKNRVQSIKLNSFYVLDDRALDKLEKFKNLIEFQIPIQGHNLFNSFKGGQKIAELNKKVQVKHKTLLSLACQRKNQRFCKTERGKETFKRILFNFII